MITFEYILKYIYTKYMYILLYYYYVIPFAVHFKISVYFFTQSFPFNYLYRDYANLSLCIAISFEGKVCNPFLQGSSDLIEMERNLRNFTKNFNCFADLETFLFGLFRKSDIPFIPSPLIVRNLFVCGRSSAIVTRTF